MYFWTLTLAAAMFVSQLTTAATDSRRSIHVNDIETYVVKAGDKVCTCSDPENQDLRPRKGFFFNSPAPNSSNEVTLEGYSYKTHDLFVFFDQIHTKGPTYSTKGIYVLGGEMYLLQHLYIDLNLHKAMGIFKNLMVGKGFKKISHPIHRPGDTDGETHGLEFVIAEPPFPRKSSCHFTGSHGFNLGDPILLKNKAFYAANFADTSSGNYVLFQKDTAVGPCTMATKTTDVTEHYVDDDHPCRLYNSGTPEKKFPSWTAKHDFGVAGTLGFIRKVASWFPGCTSKKFYCLATPNDKDFTWEEIPEGS